MPVNSLSIVIPIYNEEESIPELHAEIEQRLEPLGIPWEVIYVDDGSRDRSFELLRQLHERRPDVVRAIRLRRNFGQTAAMAAGFDAAQGDLVIPMDADLQNDPADVAKLVAKVREGYDVVSGWRFDRQDAMISRKLPSMLANGLISRLTGVHLHDYGCTLKAYRREVIAHMHLYGELHRFLPALASWAGANVAEVKVNHRARRHGKSKYGISRTIRVVLDLITVKFLLSYSTKPMQIFGKWGFYSVGLGVISALITAYEKFFSIHLSVNRNGWLFLTMFFMLGGLQLICMGLLGELSVRTYYESQNKPIYTVREMLGEENPADPQPVNCDTANQGM